jgi:anti-sigma regulatory factor (Ser/Thr protein kinase)
MVPGFRFRSRLALARRPSAPARARRHTREVLQGWCLADEVVQDALTIVSELTTNAVRHAGESAEQTSEQQNSSTTRACALTLWIAQNRLFVAVSDQSERLPELRPASLDAESGRGLLLIAGLTEGIWGFERAEPVGKIVWAGLAIAVPPTRPSRLPPPASSPPSAVSGRLSIRSAN